MHKYITYFHNVFSKAIKMSHCRIKFEYVVCLNADTVKIFKNSNRPNDNPNKTPKLHIFKVIYREHPLDSVHVNNSKILYGYKARFEKREDIFTQPVRTMPTYSVLQYFYKLRPNRVGLQKLF